MFVTRSQMEAANIPHYARDRCAHLLIPLNHCRYKNFYLPWKCDIEKTAYEYCQYKEYHFSFVILYRRQRQAAVFEDRKRLTQQQLNH